jgi:hypothetical protein
MKQLINRIKLALGLGRVEFLNIGEGAYEGGLKTFKADAAITDRYLLGKAGSDSQHIAICGANDTPKCIITDEAAAAEDAVACELLGAHAKTSKMVASAAIAVEALLAPAANGQVVTLPASAGTYWIVGRALNAAGAAGDEIEVTPCFPHQVTVS